MVRNVRRLITCGVLLLVTAFGALTSGCIIDDSPPPQSSEDAGQVELLVFRCGDVYLTHEQGNLDWLATYGDVPSELSLEDGEFAYVNADIARMTGGVAFYAGNPEIKTVNSMAVVSFDELVESGELPAYDPEQKHLRGLGFYVSDTATYCIAQNLGTYYVYENGICIGEYHTEDDMVRELGLI